MMNIGEFAALTGLSVKALHHYDERGVLAPDSVDPFTGYRKYTEDQVRGGLVLGTLRDAGVSVPEAAVATASPLRALRDHRARVLAERDAEDRAFERAQSLLRSLDQPVDVTEVAKPAQPYVAAVLTADDDTSDELVEQAMADLWQLLSADGVQPTGPLWISMRIRDRETIELACCLPTSRRLPSGWGGGSVEVGELPARTELCAVWSPAPGEDVPDGVTHPALVGLLDAVATHPSAADFADSRELRQTATGTSPEDWRVEIAVTVG
ncbi:MAG: MerR family transcriptional regulator [Brevibacterium yomogidense]|uniref:MerR family transcriptional regulator n=1 Tax=Brevibacterium sp. Mu109 TaxID=1255669 RepID=UPI000C57DDAD|nr:MerR family DNA-binding transcriptional regulator [Brevibacterium sp. Mu109]SMX72533.1 DNA-binding transcriptional regulator, MerR family [Brevibacterium sp. Mu109]